MKCSPEYLSKVFVENVYADCYHLKKLTFQPDVVYDIGGNVGTFAMFAKMLFPLAKIITVEPDPDNFARLQQVAECLPDIVAVHAAIGTGQQWKYEGCEPGMHHFISAGVGYTPEALDAATCYQRVEVPTILLDALYAQHGGKDILVKMDCEGAELDLFQHAPSDAILRQAHYVCAEIHFAATSVAIAGEAYMKRLDWIHSMQATHAIDLDIWCHGATVWMTKR